MDAAAGGETEKPGAVSAPEAAPGLLSGLKGFVVWVGGAVGGITALMYGAGYLVTRAHLSMLGLYGFVEVDHEYFLQEGAKFFVVVGFKLARTGAPLLATGILFVLLVFLIYWRVARSALGRRVAAKWSALGQRQFAGVALPAAARFALFIALLLGAIGYSSNAVVEVQGALCISNLLYVDQPQTTCGGTRSAAAEPLRAAIVKPDREVTNRQFEMSLFDIVGALILMYAAWYFAPLTRYRALLMSPLLMALVLFAIQLPMSYGILERSLTYPVVQLNMDPAHALSGAGPYFLLNKADGGFVVWDRGAKRVLWLPGNSVERAEIFTVENLFAPEQTPPPKGNAP